MKNSKTLFIFFLLILISGLSLQVSGRNSLTEHNSIVAENTYHLQVSTIFNETVYYIEVETAILDFKVSVINWGGLTLGSYEGLLIQLYFDYNESELNGWLIPYGDTNEHNFATENQFHGIFRLIFSSLSIDLCDFTLTIEESIPIWTYEYDIFSNNQIIFGVERSVIYYSNIYKIVIILVADTLDQGNFTLEILDEYNNIISSKNSSFISQKSLQLVLFMEQSLNYNYWYKLRIVQYDLDTIASIRCQLHYDHFQVENIGRMFLQDMSKNLEEISIDSIHSHPSFQWLIEEERKKIRIPVNDSTSFRSVIGTVLSIYGTLILISIFSVIRNTKRKRRKEQISESFEPSGKYQEYTHKKAEYSPKSLYDVNFEKSTTEYSLETNEMSKVQCSICLLVIKDRKEIIRCPSCDIAFHKNHLYQWIVGNGTCPACKARLTISKS